MVQLKQIYLNIKKIKRLITDEDKEDKDDLSKQLLSLSNQLKHATPKNGAYDYIICQ